MSLLSSTYVFYGDVFFVQNCFIRVTVFLLMAFLLGKRVRLSICKILAMSFLSSFVELFILSTVQSYMLFVVFVHVIEMPVMVWFVFGGKKQWLLRGMIYSYFFTIVVNGVLEILWNKLVREDSYLGIVILSCICTVLGVLLFIRDRKISKGVYSVKLHHNNREQEIRALYDTGNRLKDPYTGKGVHIISNKIVDAFCAENDAKVLVPYQAVGNKNDFLEIVYVDEVIILGQKDIIKQHKIPIGIANEELFLSKPYEMILNEEVF